MLENPFTATYKYVFTDPFITALNSTINALNNSVHPGGAYPRAKVLYPSLDALQAFTRNSWFDKEQRDMLSLATATFEEFEKAYIDVMTEFEKMRKRARAQWKKDQLTSQIEGGKQDLEWLRQLKANISPVHIELQDHFYTLVMRYPRGAEASNSIAVNFFRPLYELRNEYFLRPSLEGPKAYCRVAKELKSAAYYSDVLRAGLTSTVTATWETRLEAQELELEVAMMMNELV
jgi:hypothetical protein